MLPSKDLALAYFRVKAEIERQFPALYVVSLQPRVVVYKAISAGGSLLVGKLVTRDLILRMLRLIGVRLTTQQIAKYVPVAGQAVSAALTRAATPPGRWSRR